MQIMVAHFADVNVLISKRIRARATTPAPLSANKVMRWKYKQMDKKIVTRWWRKQNAQAYAHSITDFYLHFQQYTHI